MSDSLTLARRLSALDDEALTGLLMTRQVSPRDVRDFFDLADALLAPAAVSAALRVIDRPTLEWLARTTDAGTADAGTTDAGTSDAAGSTPPAASTSPASAPAALSPAACRALLQLELAHPADPARPSDDLRPYEAVRAEARAVLDGAADTADRAGAPLGDTARDPDDIDDLIPDDPAARESAAGERAFVALSAVAELGQQLRRAPVRMRARSGLSASEEKRLAPLLGIHPERVTTVVELAVAAGLVALDDESLFSTTAFDRWSSVGSGERFVRLVGAWFAGLDEPVRRSLADSTPEWPAGDRLRRSLARLFPAADESLREGLDRADSVADFLGLTVEGRSTLFGSVALREALGDDAPGAADSPDAPGAADSPDAPGASAQNPDGVARLDAVLPPEVDRVYLQHDLSVIAPGPLAPPVDTRIRLVADIENRGVASSYRLSQQTIDRALASGETEASLREFLGGLSLTGLPQALDYLLTEGGRRHGLVRVRALDREETTAGRYGSPHDPRSGSRTEIRSTEPTLIAAIAVDQSLSPLGLQRTSVGTLVSRVESTAAYWLLLDARYPVQAEDAAGDELRLRRTRILEAPAAPPAPTAPTAPPAPTAPAAPTPAPVASAAVADLVLRLRSAAEQSPDDSTAWMTRQIDKAVRARTPLVIEVRLADGLPTRLEVTPLSLANGRLRCVDVKAGVERTVPVANILTVNPA